LGEGRQNIDSLLQEFPSAALSQLGPPPRLVEWQEALHDGEVSPVDPPTTGKFVEECIAEGIALGDDVEDAEAAGWPRLLGIGGKRRGEEDCTRASEERATGYHWDRPCGCQQLRAMRGERPSGRVHG
jgi:hypothetical protein